MDTLQVKKHPTLDVLVREDGAVYRTNEVRKDFKEWSFGSLNTASGYYRINIYGKSYSVHRIVAETFIKNPENKPTVDHINRIRTDNRACNLRWANHSEQRENSSQVLERANYNVRESDDPALYHRNWTKKNAVHVRDYNNKRYREKVEAGFKIIETAYGQRWVTKEIADTMRGIPVKERILQQDKEKELCK